MPKVFISHSNQDRELTLFVVDALRRAGFDVWVDFENIRGGADWLCEIEAGIQRCDAVVTILSAASKASVWVERECLYAFQLKKPVVTALVADILIPLHLINIQYVDLRTAPADGSAKLVLALDAILNRDSPTSDYPMAVPTREPAETNFFPYLEQFPGGETAMLVARDLFYWAQGVADEVAFAGLIQPGFHARVNTASTMATVFSVWAYRRRPSAQLPLDLLAGRHPFDSRLARREVLNKLNQLLPSAAQLPLGKVDKRPTFPLYHLSSAETLEGFKAIVLGIIGDLRDADSS